MNYLTHTIIIKKIEHRGKEATDSVTCNDHVIYLLVGDLPLGQVIYLLSVHVLQVLNI